MEKFFKLKENHTDVKTEVLAGLTTFMTMAYILAVNPGILSVTGMDGGAVFTATALASAIASFCMGVFANLPFALSAGMGLNAYFAFTVVLQMGYPWEVALAAVFVEGIIFLILSLTKVREAIFNAIPGTLKVAVSVGIGLFICFIGLQSSGIVAANESTLVSLFSLKGSLMTGSFHTAGITVILAILGVVITWILLQKNVKGNILIGILITWVLGIICEAVGFYVPNPDQGFFSVIPTTLVSMPASMAPTFGKCFDGFKMIGNIGDFLVVMFAFLFVDMFDTLGTLIGCASKANMLDKDGKLPGIKGALLADSVGTTVGSVFGTSTVTTFVESSSGIAEGGRTGLTAITTGVLFILALFLSPLFLAIPAFATAPALIVVGFLMVQQVGKIAWNDLTEAIPAFVTIVAMPFTYSISEGIALGILTFVIMNLFGGRRKNITPLMYILAVLFLAKYFII